MMIGIPKESLPGERRVALTPEAVASLARDQVQVVVETGAGEAAGYPDRAYEEKGARLGTRAEVFAEAEVVVQVRTLGANPVAGQDDLERLRPGQVVVGLAEPLVAFDSLRRLAGRRVTLLALELMPRITRAQSMDVLSSMATVAGYRAALLAASALPRLFPLLMTAAGTVNPARVLVLGAGVAGLQAIATSRRLGAQVQAYDVRPAVKEQVESLGARFVDLGLATADQEDSGGYARAQGEEFYRRQQEALGKVVAACDVVIATAAIPGQRAPVLITAEAAAAMPPGSVIVDLAAERGGNCAVTRPGETVDHHGTRVIGPLNIVAEAPYHASQMFAHNVVTYLRHLLKDGRLQVDRDDEIARETLVLRDGEVVHPRVASLLNPAAPAAGKES